MSVDGVGGPRGPGFPGQAPLVGSKAVSATNLRGSSGVDAATLQSADGAASVEAGGATAAEGALRASLQRGEISVADYVNHEVLRATAHLEGKAPAEALQQVREAMRLEFETDPALLALTRRIAAG
jgi:hypothetical protein